MNKKQKQLLFLCWLLYISAQFGRFSYSANITHVMEKYGVTHASAGLVTTYFFIAYGAGQFVNAFLCKRYNKKWVLSGALILSSAMNLAVFFGIPFGCIKYLWLANGLVQSTLWTSVILTISEHLNREHLNRASLVMSTTSLGGTALVYGMSALFSVGVPFEYVFLVSAAVMFGAGAAWLITYNGMSRGSKQAKAEELPCEEGEKKRALLARDLLLIFAVLALFIMLADFILDGIKTWVPTILKEEYGLSDGFSIFLAVLLPMCGVFGSFLAEFTLRRTKRDFIVASGVMFLLSGGLLGAVIGCLHTAWIAVLLLFILLTITLGSIVNLMTSRFPLYMRDRGNSGFMAGILDGFGYIGSAVGTVALGLIADAAGWTEAFYLLLGLAGIPVFTLLIYAFIALFQSRKRKEAQ